MMDLVFDVLLTLHLLALLAAGAAVVGVPVLMGRMATVGPELRPTFGGVAQSLGRAAQGAFLTLLVTGGLMVWVRFGGVDGLSVWFWVKMGLIVVMAVAMAVGGRLRGNPQAATVVAWVSRLALIGVVLSAVLAFN